ncbi:MAG: hypothetical protein LLG42_02720 [Chloroflexi bacterium]|nr:hypothetical protein [Chloroflexota bacterium]
MANINITTLETPPGQKNIYTWADYIELLALQNLDKEISRADVINRFQERKDLGEIDPNIISDANLIGTQDDKLTRFIDDCFRNLEYRIGAFGDNYPFTLIEKGKVLRRNENLSNLSKLYIFLLLAANLRYIDKKNGNCITTMFEIVSLEALKNYFPKVASTILFGANHPDADERYKGKLSEKIKNLAEDLNEIHLIKEEDFGPHNTGDDGLDLVAYIPFTDKARGMLYVFCQCACTEEWDKKQNDCSFQTWDSKIDFTCFFSHMVFVPFCFRNATGDWYNYHRISKSILVDRIRLYNLFLNNLESLENIGELPVVENFLSQKETIF